MEKEKKEIFRDPKTNESGICNIIPTQNINNNIKPNEFGMYTFKIPYYFIFDNEKFEVKTCKEVLIKV